MVNSVDLTSKTLYWIKPVNGWVSSVFGERVSPITGRDEFHNGTDIVCETGTPAKAVADGRVRERGTSPSWGRYLWYDVEGGYSVFYAHLSSVLVNEGDIVKQGQVIAETGNTGKSTGAHLHLTIYEGEFEKDPLLYFRY